MILIIVRLHSVNKRKPFNKGGRGIMKKYMGLLACTLLGFTGETVYGYGSGGLSFGPSAGTLQAISSMSSLGAHCPFKQHMGESRWMAEYRAMECAKKLHACTTLAYDYWNFRKQHRPSSIIPVKYLMNESQFETEMSQTTTACINDRLNFLNQYAKGGDCSNDIIKLAVGFLAKDDRLYSDATSQAFITANWGNYSVFKQQILACSQGVGSTGAGFLTKKRETYAQYVSYWGLNACGKMSLIFNGSCTPQTQVNPTTGQTTTVQNASDTFGYAAIPTGINQGVQAFSVLPSPASTVTQAPTVTQVLPPPSFTVTPLPTAAVGGGSSF